MNLVVAFTICHERSPIMGVSWSVQVQQHTCPDLIKFQCMQVKTHHDDTFPLSGNMVSSSSPSPSSPSPRSSSSSSSPVPQCGALQAKAIHPTLSSSTWSRQQPRQPGDHFHWIVFIEGVIFTKVARTQKRILRPPLSQMKCFEEIGWFYYLCKCVKLHLKEGWQPVADVHLGSCNSSGCAVIWCAVHIVHIVHLRRCNSSSCAHAKLFYDIFAR